MFEDINEAITEERRTRRRVCAFTAWIENFDTDADRERAEELVQDRSYDCRSLARYFGTKGATFNDQVVSRHRNQRCCR